MFVTTNNNYDCLSNLVGGGGRGIIGLRKYFIKGGYLELIMAEVMIKNVKFGHSETKNKEIKVVLVI